MNGKGIKYVQEYYPYAGKTIEIRNSITANILS